MSETIEVVLVDDHTLFRKGVASLLKDKGGIRVVGEAEAGKKALQVIQELHPDVVLLDINMPGINGLQVLATIKAKMPQVKVIMLTISEEDGDLFAAIKNGADGYLSKDLDPETLIEMVEGVCLGKAALTPELAKKILDEFRREETQAEKETIGMETLTDREYEILELVVTGLTNQDIGKKLCISDNTVKTHFSNILTKLHLNNRVQAAVYAIRKGLIE